MTEIKVVAFHKSDDNYQALSDRGLRDAVRDGRITEEDETLINEFVTTLQIENNLGVKRTFKIRDGIANGLRFFKTPLSENTLTDVYTGFTALKKGTALKRARNGFNEDGTIHTVLIDSGKPLSDNTVSDYMQFVKRFLLWQIDEGHSTLPRQKVEKIKIVRPNQVTKDESCLISKEEIKKLIDACTNSRDRAIIAIMYEGALRVGELGVMEWKDLDFSDPFFCTLSTDFKTGIMRHIPLHMSRPYLLEWKNDYSGEAKGNNPVFCTRQNTTLTYPTVRKLLNTLTKNAGIKRIIKPHDFRHSRITAMIQDGWHETTVKEIAWGNIQTDQFKTYAHLTRKDIINEARKRNGIEAPEEEAPTNALKPRQCPRCLTMNAPTDNFCSVCGVPLTVEIAADLQSMKDEIHQAPEYQHVKTKAIEQVKLFS